MGMCNLHMQTMLINTCPMLLIAVLGCVYLHFVHKTRGNNVQGKEGSDALRRPMIVKGLGVVNGIELSFFMMFIALLIWSFSIYLEVSFVKITAKSAAKSGEKVWEARLDSAALRLGLIGNICLAFLFFPVTRGSSVLALLGITSEASVKYHIWLGHIVMTLFTAHGVCYIVYWAVTNQLSERFEISMKWWRKSIDLCTKKITIKLSQTLNRELGYKPSTDLQTGLKKFVRWYLSYYGNGKKSNQ